LGGKTPPEHVGAEVLNNKRSLTLPMFRRLHAGLGIPAEAMIS